MAFNTGLGRLVKKVVGAAPSGTNGTHEEPSSSDAPSQRLSGPAGALQWVRDNWRPGGGIAVHSAHKNAYPEVSGYLVPTLLQYGERELAVRIVQWERSIQFADGAFSDAEVGDPYIFDSGQILRGLLAIRTLVPEALDNARRVCDWLCGMMENEGRGGFGCRYNGEIPESVHLYVLPQMVEAAEILGEPKYRAWALRAADFYQNHPDALKMSSLTHFLAYETEALIDLGRAEVALPIVKKLRQSQTPEGSVPAWEGCSWVCTPGLAQIAICLYKLGEWEPADRALAWLESRQSATGGLHGSYGPGAEYFNGVDLSWAAKFYLDAHLLRIAAFFERHVDMFLEKVSSDDGRAQGICSLVKAGDRVVEVGTGKGRFLKVIREKFPTTECVGVDICPKLLTFLPPDIQGVVGSLESVPLPDDHFDVVISVEAIEHSANPQAAVAELVRIVKPGGWIGILDKQQAHWGYFETPSWERWPEMATLQRMLNRHCDNVSSERVGYDNVSRDESPMMLWRGQKRSRLTGAQWNSVLDSQMGRQASMDQVRFNRVSEWGEVMLLETRVGDKVLEIGSGTGAISLQLARGGRKVTCMDFSPDAVKFTEDCAQALHLEIETYRGDATKRLPWPDDNFDCTWSSGLLEHFTFEERVAMLREWGRVTGGKMIHLVPNATCVPYRVGKAMMEAAGEWPYGLEMPIASLRPDYEAAGLRVTAEFSVGAEHGLVFLPEEHPLRLSIEAWMREISFAELRGCNQGYLLVTIGTKQ